MMDTREVPENLSDDGASPPAEPSAEPAAEPPVPAPPPGGRDNKWNRLAVGVPVTFVVMSLLYGVNQVMTVIVFGTICTLGIGLVLMLFVCWMVGYVVLAVWRSFTKPGAAPVAS